MPRASLLKPTHKAFQDYYDTLQSYSGQHVSHEGALETAFQRLLADTARLKNWILLPKLKLKVRGKTLYPDGTLRDDYNLPRGFWEAKDTDDDLDKEIGKKISAGYPLSNTIFEDTRRAVLFQGGRERRRFDLTNRQQLADLLNEFYGCTEPDVSRVIAGQPDRLSGHQALVPRAERGGSASQMKLRHRFRLLQSRTAQSDPGA